MRETLMRLFGKPSFAHGIHPPDLKDGTCGSRIHQFPFANLLVVPLSQHIGRPALPVVREGEEVARGQLIAEPDGFLSVAIHAPATGTIQKLAPAPSINGKMEMAFFLKTFPGSTQEPIADSPFDADESSRDEIIDAIQMAGIVGLGGAGFPTHAKLKIPEDKRVDTLLINGAECEPYLTTDHRVMVEQSDDIVRGIRILMKATSASVASVAIEANKEDAIDTLRRATAGDDSISVAVLPVKYPQGAEKMLISALFAREVPSRGLPVDVGVVCVNVGTAAHVGNLLPRGQGLQDRVVTVSGPAIKKKGNYRIPVGTTLRFILEYVGTESDVSSVIMGGPMMGAAAASLDIPITKGSTGVIALTKRETGELKRQASFPCIRCGHCVDACPMFLNPAQLGFLARNGRYETMAEEQHLFDCFECGCCTFVCPSHLPLVQSFRVAKRAIRKAERAT